MTSSNIAEPMIQESNMFIGALSKVMMALPIFQPPEMGALPSLYAATAPDVQPNDYFGPESWNNGKGHPVKEEPRNVAASEEHAKRLWEESERLAKLQFTW